MRSNKLSILFIVLLNIFAIIDESDASPILSIELASSKSRTGLKTVLYYIDVAKSLREKVTLNCRMAGINKYEWTILGKLGAPYYGSLIVEPDEPDENKPWEKEVTLFYKFGSCYYR